jgi:hypothetical protein
MSTQLLHVIGTPRGLASNTGRVSSALLEEILEQDDEVVVTTLEELRGIVRHEAAHLAFARTHTAEESAGHSGPSEDFALAFEEETGASTN